jgi:hypothetical protein
MPPKLSRTETLQAVADDAAEALADLPISAAISV